jgi:general secretion pathway protein K
VKIKKPSAEEGPEAFLAGNIIDAQSRFNLTNLLGDKNVIDPLELEVLTRLCATLNIDSSVPKRIADGLRDARNASNSGSGGTPSLNPGSANTTTSNRAAPLLPKNMDQLSWLGVEAASIQALKPYAVILPSSTRLNVNTASSEVLAAVIKGMDTATAARVVQLRQREPFKRVSSFVDLLPEAVRKDMAAKLDVFSDHFQVQGRLRLEDRVLTEVSMLKREHRSLGAPIKVIYRERISNIDQPGS